ncbi:hypothetical protein L3V77_21025 [Vibrio sp. DW001]|uniref:hypothetical protein n=1 Tax=Vibrio sp. DW001 TaxID=2912315 RepID=UPI0023B076BE|nr:hypothetical protein [Vibrio sp. DW001]WED29892.1 hypothetical protein L3V77_21025 [Vibrio sp. DW001]
MSLTAALKEAGTRPVKEIAASYGISPDYLRSQASRRGISMAFTLVGVTKKAWSGADVTFLRRNAKKLTARQIAEKLSRTEISVKSKATMLGIYFQKHGETHPQAIVSNHDVELCRQLDDAGLRPYQIAEKMELNYSYVQYVLKYRIRCKG